jgi:hypothetical protein
MTVLFPDTRPEAEEVQLELLRQTPPWRKLEMLGQNLIGGSVASTLHGVVRTTEE